MDKAQWADVLRRKAEEHDGTAKEYGFSAVTHLRIGQSGQALVELQKGGAAQRLAIGCRDLLQRLPSFAYDAEIQKAYEKIGGAVAFPDASGLQAYVSGFREATDHVRRLESDWTRIRDGIGKSLGIPQRQSEYPRVAVGQRWRLKRIDLARPIGEYVVRKRDDRNVDEWHCEFLGRAADNMFWFATVDGRPVASNGDHDAWQFVSGPEPKAAELCALPPFLERGDILELRRESLTDSAYLREIRAAVAPCALRYVQTQRSRREGLSVTVRLLERLSPAERDAVISRLRKVLPEEVTVVVTQ